MDPKTDAIHKPIRNTLDMAKKHAAEGTDPMSITLCSTSAGAPDGLEKARR